MSRDAEMEALARTYVWWQEPEATLASPRKLLCQVLRFGRDEDYVLAEEIWGREALRDALLKAERGDIDPKSANFWRLWFSIEAQQA